MRSSRFHALLGSAVIVSACVAAYTLLERARDEVIQHVENKVAGQVVRDARARPAPPAVPVPDEFQQLRRYLPSK